MSSSLFKEPFDATLFDLFCIEIDAQCQILNEGLIEIERKQKNQGLLEKLMRAAHSIKGAARIMNLNPIVRLAHSMEDCFVAAQQGQIEINIEKVNQLLSIVDLLTQLTKIKLKEVEVWLREQLPAIESLIAKLTLFLNITSSQKNDKSEIQEEETQSPQVKLKEKLPPEFKRDRLLRITADHLNRLMGLAGESLVESHWLHPFATHLQKFKNTVSDIENSFDILREDLEKETLNERTQQNLTKLRNQLHELYSYLSEHLFAFDDFIRRHAYLSDQLYEEVIESRMRPFADGIKGFPRMIRDLSHQLGKQVRLEIEGTSTLVDREILEKLESPLSQLLRNAVDHGIEFPEERLLAGKPREGVIKLEAQHRGGTLAITISDDGQGVNIEHLRHEIIEKNIAPAETVRNLTETEVLDYLFLPSFSTSKNVTDISGRGFGLSIVKNTLQEFEGIVRIQSIPSKGTIFYLQLPLSLSVIHALLTEISGEVYAFPLGRIGRALWVPYEEIKYIENRQFFYYEGQNIALIPAWTVLELNKPHLISERLFVIVLKEQANTYGLIVDRFIGERELVVQELDSRLGKIPDISAGALMEDGSPLLIIDIDDIVQSMNRLLSSSHLLKNIPPIEKMASTIRKRILIVDDSLTVREALSRLLINQGYEVDTAANGVAGWNAICRYPYDLVITDLDMPYMDGIDLIRTIRKDPNFQKIPVIMMSYKEEGDSRKQSLESGANTYLAKSSLQDAGLIKIVKEFIGDPTV